VCVCLSGHLMPGSLEYLSNALINSFIQMYILSQLINRWFSRCLRVTCSTAVFGCFLQQSVHQITMTDQLQQIEELTRERDQLRQQVGTGDAGSCQQVKWTCWTPSQLCWWHQDKDKRVWKILLVQALMWPRCSKQKELVMKRDFSW